MALDATKLKWIAIIGMITNHAVIALREIIPFWLQLPMFALGGVTFPIMAYFVIDGYRHTSNLKKYILRILIFGLIAQPFHILVFRAFIFNIMFTIVLGILMIMLYDKLKIRWLFWVIFVATALVTFLFDWGVIGVVMMLMYYVITDEKRRRFWPVFAAVAYQIVLMILIVAASIVATIIAPEMIDEMMELAYGIEAGALSMWVSLSFFIGIGFAAFLLKKYNGERGKKMGKYTFYIIYPLHLVVLGLTALALGLVSFQSIFEL